MRSLISSGVFVESSYLIFHTPTGTRVPHFGHISGSSLPGCAAGLLCTSMRVCKSAMVCKHLAAVPRSPARTLFRWRSLQCFRRNLSAAVAVAGSFPVRWREWFHTTRNPNPVEAAIFRKLFSRPPAVRRASISSRLGLAQILQVVGIQSPKPTRSNKTRKLSELGNAVPVLSPKNVPVLFRVNALVIRPDAHIATCAVPMTSRKLILAVTAVRLGGTLRAEIAKGGLSFVILRFLLRVLLFVIIRNPLFMAVRMYER